MSQRAQRPQCERGGQRPGHQEFRSNQATAVARTVTSETGLLESSAYYLVIFLISSTACVAESLTCSTTFLPLAAN